MTYLEFYELYEYCKGILETDLKSKSIIAPGVNFDILDPTWDEFELKTACGRIVYIFENAKITTSLIGR